MAIAFWKQRGVGLLDLRPLYLRPEAHPANPESGGAKDCLHFCVFPGPLDSLVPSSLQRALKLL